DDEADGVGEFGGVAQPRRVGNGGGEALLGLFGEIVQQGRQEDAGRYRVHPYAETGQFARRREGHGYDAALGGGIGGLPDLPLEGGNRGGVDDDAARIVVAFG